MSTEQQKSIKVDKDNYMDCLKVLINNGQMKSGALSLRDGFMVVKCINILKNKETTKYDPEEYTLPNIFTKLFRCLDVLNASKAYSLDDAYNIILIVDYITENILNPEPSVTEVPAESEPKIKEI